MVLLTITVVFILSKYVNLSFRTMLEYAGIIIMVIGVLSLIGSKGMLVDPKYNLTKFTIGGVKDSTKRDFDLNFESYRFCIFMGFSGLIILLISIIFYKFE